MADNNGAVRARHRSAHAVQWSGGSAIVTGAVVAVVGGALAIGIGIGQHADAGSPTPWQLGLAFVAAGILLAAIGYAIIRGGSDRDEVLSAIKEMQTEVSGEVAMIGDATAARHVDMAAQLHRIEGGVGASLELRNILSPTPSGPSAISNGDEVE